MKTLFTLSLFTDDMGSFKQPGCASKEDALWHINSARAHDGLRPLDMDDLEVLLRGCNWGHAKLTAQN
jgi:hypothetical protein